MNLNKERVQDYFRTMSENVHEISFEELETNCGPIPPSYTGDTEKGTKCFSSGRYAFHRYIEEVGYRIANVNYEERKLTVERIEASTAEQCTESVGENSNVITHNTNARNNKPFIIPREMIDDFVNGLTLQKTKKGTVKKTNQYMHAIRHLSIKKYIDIKFAAVKLYISGTPFANYKPFLKDEETLESTLTPIIKKICAYFNSTANATYNQADFDEFHNEVCEMFINSFAVKGYAHTYGNAQKFVNMLFKYLACFKDYADFAKKGFFKYCHMALDGYTYYGNYELPYYQGVIYNPACGKSLTVWSELNKVDIRYKGYLEIISDIRAYIPDKAKVKTYNDYLALGRSIGIFATIPPLAEDKDYVLTPFEAEFFIWAICKACEKLPPAEVERVREAF